MGFFDNSRFLSGLRSTHGSIRSSIVEGSTGAIGSVAKPIRSAVGATVETAGKAVGVGTGLASAAMTPFKKPLKFGLIAGAVTAGAAALGIMASNMRRNRRYTPERD